MLERIKQEKRTYPVLRRMGTFSVQVGIVGHSTKTWRENSGLEFKNYLLIIEHSRRTEKTQSVMSVSSERFKTN